MPTTLIITGASRGLGAAAAREAAEMGAQVVLHARSEQPLQALASELAGRGLPALAVAGDIGKEADRQRLVHDALARFSHLDAVVNNAGVLEPIAPFAEIGLPEWQHNLQVNLEGPMMLMRTALPYLRERKGRVVNVSSGAAVRAVPGWAAYCAAKAALNQLTRVLALEEPSVVALSFRPGMVDTAMQGVIRHKGVQGMPQEEHARFLEVHRTGGLLSPGLPGRALAALALFAPPELSGEFLNWDDERVQALIPGRQE